MLTMKKNRLVSGSLFTGIGGLDLGLERAGIEVEWQVENNDFCRRVLKKHWPKVNRKVKDVKEAGRKTLRPVDIVFGGFPCQPHSSAGKRKGEKDDRNLWPEFCRVVTELRPRWILAENVPHIRFTILDTVFDDLERIGYSAKAVDLPAASVDAPHIRHRTFILAYTGSDVFGTGLRQDEQTREWWRRLGDGSGPESLAHSLGYRLEGWWERAAKTTVVRGGGRGDRQPDSLSNANGSNGQWGSGPVQVGRELVSGAAERDGRGRGIEWPPEPDMGRVAYGVPDRVDRLEGLGNAVVPQQAEFIGHLLVFADSLLCIKGSERKP